MSLALPSATSTACFDWLLLTTRRGVPIQVLAATSRLATYPADSLVRLVGRNVSWIVSCTISALSHKLFSRGADASRVGRRDSVPQVRFYFANLWGERVPWFHSKPPLVQCR